MHRRREFLEAIRDQIKTISGRGGVYIQQVAPIRNTWPCFTIYPETESIETLTIHGRPRPQDRTFNVTITAWIRGTPDDEKVSADMDAIGNQIETAMNSNFGADDCTLILTEFIVSEDEPEIHRLVLTYTIRYFTTES